MQVCAKPVPGTHDPPLTEYSLFGKTLPESMAARRLPPGLLPGGKACE